MTCFDALRLGVGVAVWAKVGVERGSSNTLRANTPARPKVENLARFIVTIFS
jgi:hypothetical protein